MSGDLVNMTDVVISFMKNFDFYGVNLWFLYRTGQFITIVVFPLVWMFINFFGSSSDG